MIRVLFPNATYLDVHARVSDAYIFTVGPGGVSH